MERREGPGLSLGGGRGESWKTRLQDGEDGQVVSQSMEEGGKWEAVGPRGRGRKGSQEASKRAPGWEGEAAHTSSPS